MLWACSEQVYLSAAVIAFRTGIPLASRQLHPVGNPVGEDDLPRDSTQSVQTRQRCLVWKRAAELPRLGGRTRPEDTMANTAALSDRRMDRRARMCWPSVLSLTL